MLDTSARATLALALAALILAAGPSPAQNAAPAAGEAPAAAEKRDTGGTGLPIPRYVSLKSDRINLRTGPGKDYPTSWVFRRAGEPVEITKEFESWREVRDADGTSGWVLQSLLSARRTALIAPWEAKEGAESPKLSIYAHESTSAHAVAMVEPGVIADIQSCDGSWCRVSIEDYRGYIQQNKLWGVYEGEVLN